MGRHKFELSKETIAVFNGHSAAIAEEYDCDPSYISQILGKTATDPFSRFVPMFAAAVRAGCDVSPYLNRLEAIVAKYRNMGITRSPFACLADKISGDATTTKRIVASLEDGAISDKEIAQIQNAIRAERRVLNELEMGLLNVRDAA
jgi:hypothetical protein